MTSSLRHRHVGAITTVVVSATDPPVTSPPCGYLSWPTATVGYPPRSSMSPLAAGTPRSRHPRLPGAHDPDGWPGGVPLAEGGKGCRAPGSRALGMDRWL